MISRLFAFGAHVGLATALAVAQSGCSLRLTAGSGPVGQVASGQIRAGAGIEAAMFELRGDQLVDSLGRACHWTPILQYGDGQKPDSGFAVGCGGAVLYKNQTALHECVTEEQNQRTIQLEPKGADCVPATLIADSCAQADCSPPWPAATEPASVAPRPCPADLSGAFEFPHLIVPVDEAQPDRAVGTSYFGQVSPTVSSLFNFDIPAGDGGKSCSLVLFPRQSRGETFPPAAAGACQLQFMALRSAASENSTYGTRPAQDRPLLRVTAVSGNNYTIDSFDCPADRQIAIEMSGVGPAKLKYFQNYNPSPIGLYNTKC